MSTIRHRIQRLLGTLSVVSVASCLAALAFSATASAHAYPTITASASAIPRTLSAAARARTVADHVLIADARKLKQCEQILHAPCTAARRAVQRSGYRLKNAENHLSKLARGQSSASRISDATQMAPQLSVSGQHLSWTSPARVKSYVFVREVPGLVNQYEVLNGTSILPPPVPGVAVTYSVRTNVAGSAWATEKSITYPAETSAASSGSNPTHGADAQGAPELSVSGTTLVWKSVSGVNTYVLVQRGPGSQEQYSVVLGTSYAPSPVAGATVHYSLRTAVDGSAWAPEVSISYPSEKSVTAPVPTPTPTPVGSGGKTAGNTPPSSGSEAGNSSVPFEMALVPGSLASTEPGTIHQLGAHSVRMGYPIETPASQLASVMEEYAKVGIRIMPLATFTGTVPTSAQAANLASWAAAYGPGGTFWRGKSFPADTAMTDIEFGNETSYTYQFGDNSEEAIAERAQSYALRFKEAEEGIHAVAPGVGLLAQGDNGETDGSTWVNNMFKAVPNLAQLVAGWTIHPYGTESVRRINEMIAQTQAVGAPSTIPIYVTEWGLSTDNGRCLSENYGWNPCMSYEEAATDLATSVAAMHEHFGGRLHAIYLYQAQDLASSGSSTNREEYFGALQQDGARKGAYTTEVEALLHANP
jgi:hypothetical protein